MPGDTISPLDQLRDGMALIREAIEEHVPIGALEAPEHTGVEPLEEVAALVRAIHAIGEKPNASNQRDRLATFLTSVTPDSSVTMHIRSEC